jgi:protocatechuate 3,4-dioxygenase beta subunit
MKRRTFLRDTAFGAIAVSASGFISFDGSKYVGDCETTTDILGPFYRPGSPVRTDLTIAGEPGIKVLLTGKVKHNDCVTPYKKAKIELWHCSATGEYDNSTSEFRYRATTFSNDDGGYFFNTILPVPYGIPGDRFRPAHFHLMITAEGYQPLITQLYFEGDKHLSEDPSSSSPTAARRILKVSTLRDNTKKVVYDISMSPELAPEITAIDKLSGVYVFESGDDRLEFFKNKASLWIKNDVYGTDLHYIGNNTFSNAEFDEEEHQTFRFEILPDGNVKLFDVTTDTKGNKKERIASRMKS